MSMFKTSIASRESAPCTYFPSVEAQNEPHPMGIGTNPTCRCTKRHRPMGPPSAFISHMAMLVPRESGTCTYFPSVDAKNEQSVHNNCELFSKRIILGDPGADSGVRRKVKNGEKSPWGQCLTRPVPNGCRRSGF